jgi:hypothetical protein
MSFQPRLTLRLLDLRGSGGSLASSFSHVAARDVPRGVLLPLPPTLGTLKAAAMEQAQSHADLKRQMTQARLKRRQQRAATAAAKRDHTNAAHAHVHKKSKTNGTTASSASKKSTLEQKSNAMTDEAIGDQDDEEEVMEDQEPDSEDESQHTDT